MSHKKPWLATPECGAANDHLGGFICPVSEFKIHLDFLEKNRWVLNELSEISFEHWNECYSWPIVLKGWTELIDQGFVKTEFYPSGQLIEKMLKVYLSVLKFLDVRKKLTPQLFFKSNYFIGKQINNLIPDAEIEHLLESIYSSSVDLNKVVEVAEILTEQNQISTAALLYFMWINYSISELKFAAIYNLGILYETLGDVNSAKQAYEWASSLNPDFELARANLSRLLQSSN